MFYFLDLPPPMMYHPHRMPFIDPLAVLFPSQNLDRMPFIEPPPVLVPSQKAPLKTKILNQVQEAPLKIKILNQDKKAPLKTKILKQVQYYLSEDNLPNDVYLRKRMNDEGFVHIEFISGFNKLKALTSNVQLVLDSLRDSDIIEVQRYYVNQEKINKNENSSAYINELELEIVHLQKENARLKRQEKQMQLKMAEATQHQTKKILQRSWTSPF
ncbi:unnamed protein product [Brassica rapa]|uniref:HTH La-type RNA-binding domain-containing protein n=1 Tax=Brassica campestris TaxID=3711 RepID=A0A8D9FYL8_BRACM|nr:unnamed protein product [Brassica rapa]